MYMIKISSDKVEHLAETAEKMLRYGGKMMECIEELKGEEAFGERSGYGMRGGYGRREDMDYRYPVDEGMGMRGGYGRRDEEEGFTERHNHNSMGRFSRM